MDAIQLFLLNDQKIQFEQGRSFHANKFTALPLENEQFVIPSITSMKLAAEPGKDSNLYVFKWDFVRCCSLKERRWSRLVCAAIHTLGISMECVHCVPSFAKLLG